MGHDTEALACTFCGTTPKAFGQWCGIACMNRSRTKSPPDRFWPKVAARPDGCWIWTAGRNSEGYGSFLADPSLPMVGAHVWAYEALVGPVQVGLELDHLCRVRHCVNPTHLEPVTTGVNQRRGIAARPSRTHCRRGHPATTANIKLSKTGRRTCRICQRITDPARLARLQVAEAC